MRRGDATGQVKETTDVRFGSKADILRCESDVRFTPESEHSGAQTECPRRANSGLMHRHKLQCLFGTSSARESAGGQPFRDMLWRNPSSCKEACVDLCRTANNPVAPIPVTQPSKALHAGVRYPMAADNEASLGSSGQCRAHSEMSTFGGKADTVRLHFC